MNRKIERGGGSSTHHKPGLIYAGVIAAVLIILLCSALSSMDRPSLPTGEKHGDDQAMPASGENYDQQTLTAVSHTPRGITGQSLPGQRTVSYADLNGLFSRSIVLFSGSQEMLLKGEWADLPAGPVIKDGILYVPVQNVFEHLGASVTKINDMLFINSNGVVSALMEQYNVALINTDSLIMEAAPIIRGDVYYIPADAAGKILNMPSYHSVTQQMLILGGSASEPEEVCEAIKRHWGLPVNPMPESSEIRELTVRSGCDYQTLCSAAQSGRLYVGDNRGGISSWKLNESGELRQEQIRLSAQFGNDCVLIAGAGGNENRLYENRNGEWIDVSPLPSDIWSKEVQEAIEAYFLIKAAIDIDKRPGMQEALEACREAAVNDLTNPLYQELIKTGPDAVAPISPPASAISSEEQWAALCECAKPGDFLLFRCPGAGTEYGYFNHSALILDIDRAGNMIRLLQARGAEYGVGADESIDYLSFQSFYEEDYWMETDTAVLCTGIGLKDYDRGPMTEWAYKKFNGYQFGYGSWQGIEETNCAELIRHAYLEYGVQLVSGDYASRLKELLEGDAKNLVVLPDDLLLSENVLLKAVWQRQRETGTPDGG